MAETYRAATNIKVDGDLIERGEKVTQNSFKTKKEGQSAEEAFEAAKLAGSVLEEREYYLRFPEEAANDASGDADELLQAAQEQADQILADAHAEAQRIVEAANADAAKQSGNDKKSDKK